MFLFCIFPWPYVLNVHAYTTKALIISVWPPTCSVICSEQYAFYLGNFNDAFEVFSGPLSLLPLIEKTCAEVKVVECLS